MYVTKENTKKTESNYNSMNITDIHTYIHTYKYIRNTADNSTMRVAVATRHHCPICSRLSRTLTYWLWNCETDRQTVGGRTHERMLQPSAWKAPRVDACHIVVVACCFVNCDHQPHPTMRSLTHSATNSCTRQHCCNDIAWVDVELAMMLLDFTCYCCCCCWFFLALACAHRFPFVSLPLACACVWAFCSNSSMLLLFCFCCVAYVHTSHGNHLELQESSK